MKAVILNDTHFGYKADSPLVMDYFMTFFKKQLFPYMKKPQILADNLQFCSCYMCGNPRRRWREKTLKEKQFVAIPIDLE
jgi:hypothetical protein